MGAKSASAIMFLSKRNCWCAFAAASFETSAVFVYEKIREEIIRSNVFLIQHNIL